MIDIKALDNDPWTTFPVKKDDLRELMAKSGSREPAKPMEFRQGHENTAAIAKKCWQAWLDGVPSDVIEKEWSKAPQETFMRMAVYALDEISKNPSLYLDGWKELRWKIPT